MLQLRPQMLSQLVQVRIGPPVAGLGRIVSEVVQLPLVVERAHPIRLSAKPIRREVANARFGPGGWVIEGAHQLPQVAVAAGNVVDADHQALEVRRHVRGHPDTQRRWWIHCPS